MAEKRNAPATVTEWYPFGFSGAGVNIVANDKASIATVRRWLHQAEVAQPTIDALRAEIDELRAKLALAEQDARRYRWLRDNCLTNECLDSSVDAAIASQGAK